MMRFVLFCSIACLASSPAFANSGPAPLSSEPIDWLLPAAGYILPGVIAAVVLNEFGARFRIFWRIFLAIVFPVIFWTIFMVLMGVVQKPILSFLIELPLLLLTEPMIYVVAPSAAVIVAFGLLDEHRQRKARKAEFYSVL